jgi:hypothetical protein
MRSYLQEKVTDPVCKTENTALGIRCADHDSLYPQNSALTSPISGGRLVVIIRSRTQTLEFFMILLNHIQTILRSIKQYSRLRVPWALNFDMIAIQVHFYLYGSPVAGRTNSLNRHDDEICGLQTRFYDG